ncbi:MAG: hypothetical protein VB122_05730 [Erysipelotrichales bacterium]|nr:hypothetical protein [Erysipelotrichales bacterium]
MKYSDLIVQEHEYTYSANIQFDIENDKKLGRFIPNETTIDLLKEYFIDIIKPVSFNHARILYGSYGTGKSHFLTVLSDLLGKIHVNGLAYRTFLNRVEEFDENLRADIDAFVRESKPYLVVPIVFDFEDFDRCIYFSLRKVLDSKNIKVNLKSFYTYALELVGQWKSKSESSNKLEQTCLENKITVEKLIEGLNSFDSRYQELFIKIFSSITYGVPFVHEATNLSENLDEVNKTISSEFRGIVFIFDEFGRYLEDNIKKIKIKAVQDIAEYCDHSKYDNHIILVSHKEISQYTKEYSETLINEWKKVEGRYKAIPINDKKDQCLSLIRNILVKNADYWPMFQQQYQSQLNDLFSQAMDFKGFLVDKNNQQNPFEGGFPIHPIALFALDKLSKRVAQSERTFFTYLAGKEENSLYHFLENTNGDEFHYVGLDNIYDYFEPNIKAFKSDESYRVFRKLQSAIGKCESSIADCKLEIRILKTLAVINIIDDNSVLVADKKIIKSVIDDTNDKIEKAFENLTTKKIIKFSRQYEKYNFFDSSVFDIDAMIDERTKDISDEVIPKTLNSNFVDFILYPHDYNEDYKMKRLFVPIFTTEEEFGKKSFVKQAPDFYDGILAMILGNANTDKTNILSITARTDRTIAVVNSDCRDLLKEVKKYIAVLYLESRKHEYEEKDPDVTKEIEYYKDEQEKIIRKMILEWRTLKSDSITIAYTGIVIENIHSYEDLSIYASEVMAQNFPQTIIVNNELLNKNNTTGAMNAAKKIAIHEIFTNMNEENYYGLNFLSPEYTCFRSVLAKNGIYNDVSIENINTLPNGQSSSRATMDIINKHIKKYMNSPTPLSEMYEELKAPPLGLRDGYLSILLAYALRRYKPNLVVSCHDVEQEITAELFENLIKRPYEYVMFITDWDDEQLEYISGLEELFASYINKSMQNKNRLKALYEAINSHYKNISKFSRTSKVFVSDIAKTYRRIIEKTYKDYIKFFFGDFNKISGNLASTVEAVKNIKIELEQLPEKTMEQLCEEIKEVFYVSEKELSLSLSLCKLYECEWQKKRQKSFDFYTNNFLDMVSKIDESLNDEQIVGILAKLFTGFDIDYWNDTHKDEFINRLIEVRNKLDRYIPAKEMSHKEVKMTLESADGKEKIVVFEKSELSQISSTMKNKLSSTINNFGQSISYEEKVQVLLALMDDLLQNN